MINIGNTINRVHNAINTGMSKSVKYGNKRKSLDDRYTYDIYAMRAYCGDGFYCANYNYMDGKETLSYGKDVHWAYGGALVNNEFPLSNNIGDKPTKCGIVIIQCSYFKLKDKYKNFDISLFSTHKIEVKKNNIYFYFTTLDYEIFTDLYDSDATIKKTIYYQDVGPLPDKLKDLTRENYKLKKLAPEEDKPQYEMCFYGLFAMDLQRKITELNEEMKQNPSKICENTIKIRNYSRQLALGKSATGLSGYRHNAKKSDGKKEYKYKNEIRPIYCIIATWQTAYLRYSEWQLFKQYNNKVIYMNTDSIYTTEPIDTGEDKGLGYYGIDYEKKLFLGIRRNAYILLNEDGSFYQSTIGGVLDNYFTQQQINQLKLGIPIKARSRQRDRKTDEIYETTSLLKPTYIVNSVKKNVIKI